MVARCTSTKIDATTLSIHKCMCLPKKLHREQLQFLLCKRLKTGKKWNDIKLSSCNLPFGVLYYDKYFKEDDEQRNTLTKFNSDNTCILNVEETKAKNAFLLTYRKDLQKGS